MAGGAIRTIDPEQYRHAPLRGAVFVDVSNDYLHPQGYLDIITGVAPPSAGRFIANLMGAPSVNESDEISNPFQGMYGRTSAIKGEDIVQSSTVNITASITCHTLENLKLLRPDLAFSYVYGADGAFATLSIGTGAAGVTYTSDARGVGGNDIRAAQVNPGVSSPLSVSVSGNDISVSLAHNGTALTSTAAQVRDAVNAHPGAAALVNAGLTGDGTGVAVAQAMTNLSGGTQGTVVGVRAKRTLSTNLSDHRKNMVLAYSTSEMTIGGAIILRNVKNNNEDREYSFNDDLEIFGVEGNWQAYSDGSSMDPATGLILPDWEEHNYRETVIPAGL
jgi:hypothetical protein